VLDKLTSNRYLVEGRFQLYDEPLLTLAACRLSRWRPFCQCSEPSPRRLNDWHTGQLRILCLLSVPAR
jgi:hypothetical protein